MKENSIAVLVPCYNEESTIDKVVRDFRKEIPLALVYVYSNSSTDNTAEVARKAGAIVREEPNKGKGNVVRRMFSDIEADIYIIVDGDDTYESSKASKMIDQLSLYNLDMIVATRKTDNSSGEYRWRNITMLR